MRLFFLTAIILVWLPQLRGEALIVPYPGFKPSDLGKSIDISTGEVLGDCMNGSIGASSNKQISHGLDFSMKSIDLHRKIHGSLSSSLSIGGLLGFGSSVELTKEIHADLRSLTIVFNILYNHGSVFLLNPLKAMDSECDRYFVSGYTHGAILAVGIKIKFKSKEEKTRFKRKISSRGLFGLIKNSKTDVKEARKMMESSSVVSRISLEGAYDDSIESLGNRMLCNAKNLDKCLDSISVALGLVGPNGGFIEAVERFNKSSEHFVLAVYLQENQM